MSGLQPEKQISLRPQKKQTQNTENQEDKKSTDKVVARDLVKLRHVETRIQKPTGLSEILKEHIKKEAESKEKLSQDAFAAISAIKDSKRLFLERILIVVNQSRVPLGKEPLTITDVRNLMHELEQKEIVKVNTVATEGLGPREVYSLTEKGNELLE